MTSGPIMLVPVCLVEKNNEQLRVNQKALKILRKISQPVVVVAIVGPYRTGKSYLMNHLAGENLGFPLGSTVQSETKGIWMWCMPHPNKPNHSLVLLDTEGLGDVQKGDPKNDTWIFALAVLLSSMLVYNSMGTINNDALEKMHYVTELTELIRVKFSQRLDGLEDSTEFVSFFPDFVWTVRDFTLELNLHGHPITEDEYLENALRMIPGDNDKAKNTNTSRDCIRCFFPNRKCFVFDRPKYEKELLAHIEDVLENQLNPEFQEQSKNFHSHILTHAKIKTLREGVKVTGNRLLTIIFTDPGTRQEVDMEERTLSMSPDSFYVPVLSEAVRLLFLRGYQLGLHSNNFFVFYFPTFPFQDTIEREKKGLLLQNEEVSVNCCEARLKQLSGPLMRSISRGAFSVPGGHRLYLEAKKKVELQYNLGSRKGVKANEVLQSFLKSQLAVEKSILQSDKALTAKKKAIAVERLKREAAEKEQELLRQQQQEQQEMMEAQKGSLKEHIAQLEKKLDRKMENLLKRLENNLDHKLKVQEKLLTEGFQKEAEKLRKEIDRLRDELDDINTKKSSIVSQILDLVSSVIRVGTSADTLLDVVRNICDLLRRHFS
ncbi:LOW QUALITY PROTEIN: guanylate-binding protein 6-like [Marmota marmota marmota]|uniref:LOW QUALITY PROTEIN: guanylate-binding protein 6-like n=1 Tax=Marmota marmota marmota TaxID=9994 RepID=UPI002093547F|nr:LOW QUALITY PROTEIN: guanylate-binding protein 6-like [Marmota marmota marmota]